jgi:hypothetical protein
MVFRSQWGPLVGLVTVVAVVAAPGLAVGLAVGLALAVAVGLALAVLGAVAEVPGLACRVCCKRKVDTCVSHSLFGASSRISTKSNRLSKGVAMAVLVEISAVTS